MGGYFLFVALLMWGAWKLNRKAVQKRIDPRLAELEKLCRDFLSAE
jgi:hypothetical protein